MNRTSFFLGLSGAVVALKGALAIGAAAAAKSAGVDPALAVLGGAVMAGAFDVAKSLLTDRVKDWVNSPPPDPTRLFANGHLTKLIGTAIQDVLTRQHAESKGQYEVQLGKLLFDAGKYWEQHYQRFTAGELSQAHAESLTVVIHRQIQDAEDFPLATPEAWEDFLGDYAQAQGVALEDEPRRRAAERLHRELGHLIYERAKLAPTDDPQGWVALQLQFQSWLLQGIAELHESVRAGFADGARQLASLHAELVLVGLGVREIRELAHETATLLQRFDGVLGGLFALALANEERGQRMEEQLRLIRERQGDAALPPLADLLTGCDPANEFARLMDALLTREAKAQGCQMVQSHGLALGTVELRTYIMKGKFCGKEPITVVGVKWLEDALPHGGFGPRGGYTWTQVSGAETQNWITITSRKLSAPHFQSILRVLANAGIHAHNFAQPEFEPWLRRCPPLLARYYPEFAARRTDAQGFDGRPFAEWLRGFSEKVLADHRNLHLFGFPRRHRSTNDPANDPNTFLLEQVFVPQKLAPHGSTEAQARTAGQLVAGNGCHVLLGDPGAGKTSLLRYLAVACGEGREVAGVKCGPRVPLFLPLREFAEGRQERPTLLAALAEHARVSASLEPGEVHPWRIEALLLMGEAMVFFDGLDEAGDHHSRREIARLIQGFHEEYPACPVWVTSRIVGYDRASLDKEQFTHFEVTPFDPGQQAAFVGQWYLAKLPRPEAKAQREQKAGDFMRSLEKAVPEIRELATNPLLLTLAIWVHDEFGQLPPGRGLLYDKCVEILVSKRDEERFPGKKIALEQLEPALKPDHLRRYYTHLALKAQELNADRPEREVRGIIPEKSLLEWIAALRLPELRRHYSVTDGCEQAAQAQAQVILDFSEERCGLLRFRGDGTYAFLHLSFQEHLAAERKAAVLRSQPQELENFIVSQAEKAAWREMLLLLFHHLRELQVPADDGSEMPFSHWLLERLQSRSGTPPSPALCRLLGMALRDGIEFTPAHRQWILQRLLADWRGQSAFDTETFQVLSHAADFSPASRSVLLRLLGEAWRRQAGLAALLVLHLRVRLVGWPADPVESARLASELAARLGGLEIPLIPERGLFSPPPEQLPQLLRAAELLSDADLKTVSATAEGSQCVALVRELLQAAMWNPQIQVEERAGAGIVLARVGDPRPGVMPKAPFSQENPLFAWCELPAPGPRGFKMGEGHERFDCTRIRQDFRLARYPVTVAQYALFVAEGGYGDFRGEPPSWWAAAGEWQGFQGWDWVKQAKVTGPQNDSDPVFQTPNHPRIGVSWFEAVAFGRWMNQRFTPEQLGLPAGWRVRLPTEAEWEYAASAGGTRRYPWGEEDDWPSRCNCAETGLKQTSAVGLFPQGRAACGAEDLAGNVWEWCRSKLANYAGYNRLKAQELEGPEGDAPRVVRGGSWGSRARDYRAAFRSDGHPGLRDRLLGFRLAAGPELQAAEPHSGAERP